MNKKNILGIIPARGGSKGLKNKNIYPLKGEPLINYSIRASKNSKYINDTIVTSDDQKILDISKKNGANIIKRPDRLSTDHASTESVIFHLIDDLKFSNSDIIVLLQPTSPLRNAEHIDSAIEKYFTSNCDSLISVFKPNFSLFKSFKLDNKFIKKIFPEYQSTRRQDLPIVYIPNGAIYIISVEVFKGNNSFLTNKTIPFIMSIENSIDIDSINDINKVKNYLK